MINRVGSLARQRKCEVLVMDREGRLLADKRGK
jgi:hypothetical protein